MVLPALPIELDPQSVVPLHRQLQVAIRGLIDTGRLHPGDSLPPELDLAEQLGVSRNTVRQALGDLVTYGLLRRRRGAGTSVVEPAFERSLDRFYAFAWEVHSRGAEHRSLVLERASVPADDELAERLRVPRGSPLERIRRLRTADGEPLVLETAFLPAELVVGLDEGMLEREAIYDLLERLRGLRVTHARETIRPVVLQRSTAELLRVRTGAPAFLVERTTWAGDLAIEWQQSFVRGDRYLYSVELPRRSDARRGDAPD